MESPQTLESVRRKYLGQAEGPEVSSKVFDIGPLLEASQMGGDGARTESEIKLVLERFRRAVAEAEKSLAAKKKNSDGGNAP